MHEGGSFLSATPRQRYSRPAVAVVVDHLHVAGSRSVNFQADATGPARTQSDVVLKNLRTDQFGDHLRAALYDRRRLARVGGRIPLTRL